MSSISIQHLNFRYDDSQSLLFDDVSLSLDTSWKLGIIGRNGCGKTTFLNLLLGNLDYQGEITSPVSFEYFPYEVSHPEKKVGEVLGEIAPEAEDWQKEYELSCLGMNPEILERDFEVCSGGEKQRILLAGMFLKEGSFPLIDEPTNHLDEEAKEAVANYLSLKKGFILVSHDRILLDRVADHILYFGRGKIEIQKGNFSSWKENKDKRDAFEISENEKRKKEIKKLDEAAKQSSTWSLDAEKGKYNTTNSGSKIDRGYVGHKAAKLMQRSKNIERRKENCIEEKKALLQDVDDLEELKMAPCNPGRTQLGSLDQVQVLYDGKPIFEPVSFQIQAGDRIAITGGNGAGKSSLLKLILGEPLSYRGEFQRTNAIRLSYVPQQTDSLKGTWKELCQTRGLEEIPFSSALARMGLTFKDFSKRLEQLSEGQKKKVLLAASFLTPADLYLWDEPLNYVDIQTRMQLETMLKEAKPTLIFVDHDKAFRDEIATKVIDVKRLGSK